VRSIGRESSSTDSKYQLAEQKNRADDYHSWTVGKGKMRLLDSGYSGDMHYIQNLDKGEELYDPSRDPAQENNLAVETGSRGKLYELHNHLQSIS
jgi:hypothetical protein